MLNKGLPRQTNRRHGISFKSNGLEFKDLNNKSLLYKKQTHQYKFMFIYVVEGSSHSKGALLFWYEITFQKNPERIAIFLIKENIGYNSLKCYIFSSVMLRCTDLFQFD